MASCNPAGAGLVRVRRPLLWKQVRKSPGRGPWHGPDPPRPSCPRVVMPELPEVETVVRSLRPHVDGKVLAYADVVRRPCLEAASKPLSDALGLRVAGLSRRGKLVVMALGDAPRPPLRLVVHLRMTGSLLATDGLFPDPQALRAVSSPYTRVLMGLSGDGRFPCTCALRFDDVRTFGRMLLADGAGLASWPFWAKLGPEPLDLAPAAFSARLGGRRAIKAALLDQTVVAGIGNIYADESLFAAGINPLRPTGLLDEDERARLLACVQAVLSRAIAECGSSIRDYRDADGRAGAFQNSFAVYGRGGQPCRACGATLERCRVGGRSTVFCPHCQPLKNGCR